MMTDKLVECIPNVSEGKNQHTIDLIAEAINSVHEVRLLHVDSGAGANRTVFTFVGPPSAVSEAAFRMFEVCNETIDMRYQLGEHPRQGVVDVCPFVPLHNMTIEETSLLAQNLGYRIGEELNIPGWFYESSATKANRRNLATLRQGEYEALLRKSKSSNWQPDFGSFEGNHWLKTGASVIGARPFLIAYNIDIDSNDSNIAQHIANRIRERGYIDYNPKGEQTIQAGLLKGVKAIGWVIPEYGNAQVSTNIVDINIASPGLVFEAVQKEAAKIGRKVIGSELIGLIPKDVLLQSANDLKINGKDTIDSLELAAKAMKLDYRKPFSVYDRVIELVMNKK